MRLTCAHALLWFAACAQAQPASDAMLTVLATDPAPAATLARQQSFYVRFEVTTAAASGVMIGAYYKGQPVWDNGGTSGMVKLPAGGGTGVAHFFYWGEQHTRIDEVRLKVTDPRNTQPGREFTLPVNLTWTANDAGPRELAPWVREWQRSEQLRQKAEYEQYEKRMAEIGPSSFVFSLAFAAVMCALLLAGFGLPLWGALRWRGYWRMGAIGLGVLPLLSLGYILIGVSRDRTSHNLAPLELGLWLAVASGAMLVLIAVRSVLRLRMKRAEPPAASPPAERPPA